MSRMIVCARCQRERPYFAKGLCRPCYGTLLKNPNARPWGTAIGMRPRHGASRTSEWSAWVNAKQRCFNPKHSAWADYGGRGIRVADVFLGPGGFEAFLAEVGPKPGPEYSIDRINNDDSYRPGNLRWATPSQQAKNSRPRKI